MELEEASRLALELFGVEGSLRALPSYADENFRVEARDGRRFVLKISGPGTPRAALELENAALDHLAERAFPAPRVVRDAEHQDLHACPGEAGPGEERWVRLLTWMDGETLATVEEPPPALLHDLGSFLARLDRAFVGFEHPQAERSLSWDLRRALRLLPLVQHQPDRARRDRLRSAYARYEERWLPTVEALARSVIHNDANEDNVVVASDGSVLGLVDYGDMLRTVRVAEPAIAMAYAMLRADDPNAAAHAVLSGYQAEWPLGPEELELLAPLVEMRLVVSVTMSTAQRSRAPENAYVSVTEPHAWRLLDVLEGEAGLARLTQVVRGVAPGEASR